MLKGKLVEFLARGKEWTGVDWMDSIHCVVEEERSGQILEEGRSGEEERSWQNLEGSSGQVLEKGRSGHFGGTLE